MLDRILFREKVMTEIRHPESGAIIEGSALKPGDVIQRGDKYASSSGKWETNKHFVGRVVEEGCTTPWVHPA